MKKLGSFAVMASCGLVVLTWSFILPIIGILYLTGSLP